MHPKSWIGLRLVAVGMAGAAFLAASTALAQTKSANIRKRDGDAAASQTKRGAVGRVDPAALKAAEEGAESFNLDTDDGVYLATTYWRAKKPSNTTPVVVLLHGRGQSQRDLFPFAKQLHEADFAVVTFDFRGHGDSREVQPDLYKKPKDYLESKRERQIRNATANRVIPQGSRALRERQAESKKRPAKSSADRIDEKTEFRSGDEITRFCAKDLEAVKHFLLEHHNSQEFNVRNLGIVAAEMGVSVAARWMHEKEFLAPQRVGYAKTGADLRALVALSPQWNYIGYSLSSAKPPTRNAYDDLAVMIVYGNDPRSLDNGQRTAKAFNVPEAQDKGAAKTGLAPRGSATGSFALKVNSKLVGTKLLNPSPVDGLDERIIGFLKSQLSDKRSRGWERREIEQDSGGFGTAAGNGGVPRKRN